MSAGQSLSPEQIDAVTARHPEAVRPNRLRALGVIALTLTVIGYFIYLFYAFDVPKMISRADPERAQLYALDLYSYKIEGRVDLRRSAETMSFTFEGSNRAKFEDAPDWVGREGARYRIPLGGDGVVTYEPGLLVVERTGHEPVRIKVAQGERADPQLLSGATDWLKVAPNKIEGKLSLWSRFRVTRTRVDVYRQFFGWENFWFDFQSPLWGKSFSETVALAFSEERIDPAQSNLSLIWTEFLENEEWQHGEVFYALFLTVLMALVGTMLASMFGLPLAFLAARNVNPLTAVEMSRESLAAFGLFAVAFTGLNFAAAEMLSASPALKGVAALLIGGALCFLLLPRTVSTFVSLIVFTLVFSLLYALTGSLFSFWLAEPALTPAAFGCSFLLAWVIQAFAPLQVLVKKLFDVLRGVDMLIWSLIFIRAFGLGPLSGILAIFFTDTGTLGKLFSEAIENADKKQVEGVQATGADAIQKNWFGIVPQILPVFISQSLYFFESNTRSATVIGILGAGGIGLKLAETIRTRNDWENTLYMIILIVLVVILMDNISGWLRRRAIHGKPKSLEALIERQRDASGKAVSA